MTTYVRVAGHAGVWELDGPALVLTDDDMFEHPTLVNVHQAADPGHFAVVEAADAVAWPEAGAKGPGSAGTAVPFTPIADDPGQPIAV